MFRSACSDTHLHALSCGQCLKAERAVTHTDAHTSSTGRVIYIFVVSSPSRVLADLRIPLMWKDTEYFKNKGGEVPPLPS